MSAEPIGLNRASRRAAARVAARPPARTIDVEIPDGDFAGWRATARVDFPAQLLIDLESGSVTKVFAVMSAIVVEHNMPNSAGELAPTLLDVDPYAGVVAISRLILEAIGRLPPR